MAFDIERIINHMQLMSKAVKEHGHDVFRELVRTDPKKAVEEMPAFIERALSTGNNFFSGMMCGGPHPGATAPFIDSIGLIYPTLDKENRIKALKNCLGFLDGLNYFNAQNNVEKVHEPWLVADIITNRRLYWCGYEEYSKKLKGIDSFKEFEENFMNEGRLNCNSVFWLLFCLARKEHRKPKIMKALEDLFPELIDRTKDAIATYIHAQGLSYEIGFVDKQPAPYKETIEEKVTHYEPTWESDIRTKLKKEHWILLPEFFRDLEYKKERIAEEKARKTG